MAKMAYSEKARSPGDEVADKVLSFFAKPGLLTHNFRAFLHHIDRKINWKPVQYTLGVRKKIKDYSLRFT